MTPPLSDREKIAPFLSAVITASDEYGIPRSVLAAIGFRESDFTWAPGYEPKGNPRGYGDGGHGCGIFQIDNRTWGDWLGKHAWWEPIVSARKACAILRGNVAYLNALSAGPPSKDPMLFRMAVAAYNCGPGNALQAWLRHDDPDWYTASRGKPGRGDYSAWVLAKAEDLRVQMPELTRGGVIT